MVKYRKRTSRWSIFEKRGEEWVRMTNKSYFFCTAQMVWFDTLLENISNRRLQRVRF